MVKYHISPLGLSKQSLLILLNVLLTPSLFPLTAISLMR